MKRTDDVYFATLSGTKLSAALCDRVDTYQKHAIRSGFFALWLKSYQTYYGMGTKGFSSHEVRRHGASDELVKLSINHFRNLITHFLTLSTGQRAALEPVALNGDYQTEQETRTAKGVLDHWMRDSLEQGMRDAEEFAVVLGRGYVSQWWNANAGEELLPGLNGEPNVRTGALESYAFAPMDVAFDPTCRTFDVPWYITRRWVNRFDLLALFPEEATRRAILDASRGQRERDLDFEASAFRSFVTGESDYGDQIAIYEFWHKKTPACPNGRHAVFLNEDVLLYAEDLPYEDVPVCGLSPARIIGTAFGYTSSWDLLAPQEALDTLKSIELSNQAAHGLGLVAVPKGSDLSPTEIARGLHMIEYLPALGKPEVINFTATPPEVISNQDRTVQEMETISGINSVVRGQPEASLKSGSALALVQAQAIQFSSLFQNDDVRFKEGLGDDCLMVFRQYATEKIRMEIEGLDGYLVPSEVAGDDLRLIRRVRVDVGNPLMRTIAGRVQLADQLVQQQLVKDPVQYLRVIETGRLEPLTEHESKERSNIKAENELLARARFKMNPRTGQPDLAPQVDPKLGHPTGKMEEVLDEAALPVALKTDNPFLHAQQHLTVLANPFARRNKAVVRAVLAHVEAHKNLHAYCTINDPGLLELLGIPPQQAALMQVQAQQAAMAMEQAAASGEAPGVAGPLAKPAAGGESRTQAMPPPGQQPQGPARLPNLPSLPPGAAMATGVNPAAPGPGGMPA
jgi:hypothetical protein